MNYNYLIYILAGLIIIPAIYVLLSDDPEYTPYENESILCIGIGMLVAYIGILKTNTISNINVIEIETENINKIIDDYNGSRLVLTKFNEVADTITKIFPIPDHDKAVTSTRPNNVESAGVLPIKSGEFLFKEQLPQSDISPKHPDNNIIINNIKSDNNDVKHGKLIKLLSSNTTSDIKPQPNVLLKNIFEKFQKDKPEISRDHLDYKSHNNIKQEGGGPTVITSIQAMTPQLNPQPDPQLNPQSIPQQDPQLNPQSILQTNVQLSSQQDPQLNPQTKTNTDLLNKYKTTSTTAEDKDEEDEEDDEDDEEWLDEDDWIEEEKVFKPEDIEESHDNEKNPNTEESPTTEESPNIEESHDNETTI